MLTELSIRDVALFEHGELSFEGGLNVVTGETGAGKSLLIGALELLLGRQPRSNLLRRGAERACVEGRWSFAAGSVPPRLCEWLAENLPAALEEIEEGHDGGSGELELVLSRSVARDGRTRAHLNQRPVTRAALRELAGMLVEIHGQNDHQKLFEPVEQTRLIDAFGGHARIVEEYRARRGQWLELAARLRDWSAREAERRDRLDLLRFQVGELEQALPSSGEMNALRSERQVLRNAEQLGAQLGALVESLCEGEGAALDVLRAAETALERWEQKIAELAPPAAALREASAHLAQAAWALRSFLDEVECSPARLEEVETRLAQVERLERKFRCDAAELEARLGSMRAELDQLEAEASGVDELAARCARAKAELEEAAARLTAARKRLRPRLKRAVLESLSDLGLGQADFDLRLSPRRAAALASPNADGAKAAGEAEARRFGPDGADEVEMELAANPGEGRGPLRRVASGGEAARVMLALRGALAARQTIPTLVFDEIDAGVGGRLAPRVGAHLRALAEHYQILCVTHLPAVAAAARRHLKVAKRTARGRTTTAVVELEGERRVAEVADMIAGGADQETARAEARRLLRESVEEPTG